jgi:hypothetical protein
MTIPDWLFVLFSFSLFNNAVQHAPYRTVNKLFHVISADCQNRLTQANMLTSKCQSILKTKKRLAEQSTKPEGHFTKHAFS